MKSGIVFMATLQGYWAVVSIKVICRTGVLKLVIPTETGHTSKCIPGHQGSSDASEQSSAHSEQ